MPWGVRGNGSECSYATFISARSLTFKTYLYFIIQKMTYTSTLYDLNSL